MYNVAGHFVLLCMYAEKQRSHHYYTCSAVQYESFARDGNICTKARPYPAQQPAQGIDLQSPKLHCAASRRRSVRVRAEQHSEESKNFSVEQHSKKTFSADQHSVALQISCGVVSFFTIIQQYCLRQPFWLRFNFRSGTPAINGHTRCFSDVFRGHHRMCCCCCS